MAIRSGHNNGMQPTMRHGQKLPVPVPGLGHGPGGSLKPEIYVHACWTEFPSPSGSPPQLQLQPVPSLELSQPAVSANARWVVCGCACGFSYGSVSFICTADNTMHEM